MKKPASKPKEKTKINPSIQHAFPKLAIQINKNGQSGQIKIPFKNQDQLQALITQFEKISK
jgi:hypothetical protein